LLLDEQFRVTDDVDEQDVPDLEFHIEGRLRGHESSLYLKTGDSTSDLARMLDLEPGMFAKPQQLQRKTLLRQ
jgi:hypothetical protein